MDAITAIYLIVTFWWVLIVADIIALVLLAWSILKSDNVEKDEYPHPRHYDLSKKEDLERFNREEWWK